jgi:hypothetical protein
MPIYELAPIDLSDPDWRCSTHRGPCVVRADNELNARLAAGMAFLTAVNIVPGESIPIDPWTQPNKVEAHLVTEHGFAESGPQMVLAPAGDHPNLEGKDGSPIH